MFDRQFPWYLNLKEHNFEQLYRDSRNYDCESNKITILAEMLETNPNREKFSRAAGSRTGS